MISFRRKKRDTDTLAEIKEKLEKPMEFGTQFGNTVERGVEAIKTGVEKAVLEDLSKRIEEENIKISRKFNTVTKDLKEMTLENPEIVELIKLYSNTTDKLEEFIEEMRDLEGRGWDFDRNIAALFKFRVGKGLAEMKKSISSVENVCRNAGFTPSNIKEILEAPIENLVDSLAKKKITKKKSRK